jgi:3D (Asp-Asp-Asp) domain-containing protein
MRFLEQHLSSLFILLVIVFLLFLSPYISAQDVSSAETALLSAPSPLVLTQSRFHEERQQKNETIPYHTRFVDDDQLEIGVTSVIHEGKPGEKQVVTKILYYDEREYSRSSHESIIRELQDEVVARGTKIIKRTIETETGPLTYWKHLSQVWATSYDSTCAGCDETTATGMKQGYGVIAVDPTVIPLHSRVYIPGYGVAVAGDVGGLIKGNRVDLGYDSLNGQWAAHYVDVYLLVDETSQ